MVNISDYFTWSKIFGTSYDELIKQGGTLNTLINWFIGFAAVVAVIFLLIAGYQYITSAGDPDKVQRASQTLTGTIIGMVIVFVAVILTRFLMSIVTNNAQ
jgi:TRAP-type C4-dicarboxylate transport system permease small subunit